MKHNLIQEGASDDMFHFTSFDAIHSMLRNDVLRLSPVGLSSLDDIETEYQKGRMYFLSTTPTKSFNIGFPGRIGLPVRLDLDGRLIKSNFKIDRVAFEFHSSRMKDMKNMNSEGLDEMEDRVLADVPAFRFSRYVIGVCIDFSKISTKQDLYLVEEIIHMSRTRNIPIHGINYEDYSNDAMSDASAPNEESLYMTFDEDRVALAMGILDFFSSAEHDRIIKLIETHSSDEDTGVEGIVDHYDYIMLTKTIPDMIRQNKVPEIETITSIATIFRNAKRAFMKYNKDSFVENECGSSLLKVAKQNNTDYEGLVKKFEKAVSDFFQKISQ